MKGIGERRCNVAADCNVGKMNTKKKTETKKHGKVENFVLKEFRKHGDRLFVANIDRDINFLAYQLISSSAACITDDLIEPRMYMDGFQDIIELAFHRHCRNYLVHVRIVI